MNESLTMALRAALALSQRMLVLAEGQDWEGLVVVAEQRRPLLEVLAQGLADGAATPSLREGLESLLNIEQQLIVWVAQGRDAAANNMHRIRVGHRAVPAYTLP